MSFLVGSFNFAILILVLIFFGEKAALLVAAGMLIGYVGSGIVIISARRQR